VGFFTGFAAKLCIAPLGLELGGALRVLADVVVDVCTCFHSNWILEFERLWDKRPRFTSLTKAIVRLKSAHNGQNTES
jgi:hypothetical protein